MTALLSNVLERFSDASREETPEEGKTISLAQLIDALDERAFGLGILAQCLAIIFC